MLMFALAGILPTKPSLQFHTASFQKCLSSGLLLAVDRGGKGLKWDLRKAWVEQSGRNPGQGTNISHFTQCLSRWAQVHRKDWRWEEETPGIKEKHRKMGDQRLRNKTRKKARVQEPRLG